MSCLSNTVPNDLALPIGSQLLVTGATGFIASHAIREALAFGYRVRGTVRSQAKAELVIAFFDNDNFSAAVVGDYTNEGSLDAAVSDCVGIIHIASNTSLSPDPHAVIPPTVAIAVALLKAAKRVGVCQRFVFTSSASAVCIPKPDVNFTITNTMFNDESIAKAWASKPPYHPSGFYHVYAASKASAEKAVWSFVEEEKPVFAVNVVVPNTNIGRVLLKPATSSANFAVAVLNGKLDFGTHAQWMINVNDNARVHLAALIDRSLSNERILAYGHRFHWNDMLEAVRKARPGGKSLPEPLDASAGRDLTKVDNGPARELLKKWFDQSELKGLEESVRENLEGY